MTAPVMTSTCTASDYPILCEFVGRELVDELVEADTGVDNAVRRLLAEFERCLDGLGSSDLENLERSRRLQRRVSDAEAQRLRFGLLGKNFEAATRFGWKLTAGNGVEVESRSISQEVAEAEARRMVTLFDERSPGVSCECVVFDYTDSVGGVVVGRSFVDVEPGAGYELLESSDESPLHRWLFTAPRAGLYRCCVVVG